MIDTLANLPLISPFIEFGFMRRALAGCLALSLGATPIGVFLMLRRMSLAGDAMAHALLPGAAVAFLLVGLSLPAMSLGAFIAALERELVGRTATGSLDNTQDASHKALHVNAADLRPETVARSAITGLNLGTKRGGGQP